MNPLERAKWMLQDAQVLNSEVNEELEKISLSDARELRATVKHTREWLWGIMTLLEDR